MIGKLRGVVDTVGPDWVILDVGGVGYEVSCSVRTLRNLIAGEEATLAIETYVREDVIRLFGFANENERQWFRLLQSVQGVGAKVALAVLGTLTVQDLANAIALQDKAMVAQTPGVGPKVAGRLVSELKEKAAKLTTASVSIPATGASAGGTGSKNSKGKAGSKQSKEQAAAQAAQAAAAEAISALQNLGYQPIQANAAVATAMQELGPDADTAALIRRGLKELSAG